MSQSYILNFLLGYFVHNLFLNVNYLLHEPLLKTTLKLFCICRIKWAFSPVSIKLFAQKITEIKNDRRHIVWLCDAKKIIICNTKFNYLYMVEIELSTWIDYIYRS